MKYRFVDYDPIAHHMLDHWRSEAIAHFAMDGPISGEWQYYVDSDEYRVGIDTFCKVSLSDDQPIAVMIVFCHPDYPVGINPIIVAPEFCGQGVGCAVLREFLENIDAILPFHSGRVEVMIDNENIASIKAFARAGFALARKHPDGDAGIYIYHFPS